MEQTYEVEQWSNNQILCKTIKIWTNKKAGLITACLFAIHEEYMILLLPGVWFFMQQLLQDIFALKEQLDVLKPFDQTQLKNLREWFRIWFIQNSNAIEGNTLSLTEVKVLLEDGITIGWKTVKELKETLNHADVLDQLHDLFGQDDSQWLIDEDSVSKLHSILMMGTLPSTQCGTRRTTQIRISGSEDSFPHPDQVPLRMEEFFLSYAKIHTLEQVARVHYDFVKIHPYHDGNGRIARLLMNIALVGLWYFPIIIPVVVRSEYIQSLQWDQFDTRYQFFLRQTKENHKDYLRFFTK